MADRDPLVAAAPAAGPGAWRVLLRSPLGLAAIATTVALVALMVVAPIVWGTEATERDLTALSQGPSSEHPFGTDNGGRDILLRVLVAGRTSILLALAATGLGVVLGVLVGALPSVLGRRAGRFVSAAVNIAVAFPGLLLALFFATVLGVGAFSAVVALGLALTPSFARLTETLAASVAGQDFVAAARVIGVSRTRILLRHVLPNIAEPLVVQATLASGGMLLALAGLSFLGLGIQPPTFDWGRLLAEGLDSIYLNPLAALAPGLAVVLAGLAFNLTGEVLASAVGRRSSARLRGSGADRSAPVAGPVAGPVDPDGSAALVVEDLWVDLPSRDEPVHPVRGVNLRVATGEAVGIVGESGSGKTLTALAVARLLETPLGVRASRLDFQGEDLGALPAGRVRGLLGSAMPMVFQDPTSSLNPTMRIGRQLAEVAEEHEGVGRREAAERAVDRLGAVRLSSPSWRARQYPHELSGGMRQRAMIGMGLMGTPSLLICDEATTALDVVVQRDVLELVDRVRTDAGSALLMISHDIAVVASVCDRVLVMYAGRVVEDLPVTDLPSRARHPYTRALLAAVPDMATPRDRPLTTIRGRAPEPAAVPGGCAFAERCDFASSRCRDDDPPLTASADGVDAHPVACWHPQDGPVTGPLQERRAAPTSPPEDATVSA